MEQKRMVSTAYLTIWGVVACGAGALLISSSSISVLIFRSGENAGLFRIVFMGLMLSLANDIPLALIQAQQKSGLYSLLSISRFTLGLGLNILLIVGLGLGVRGVILSSLITHALASVFLGFYTLRWCGFRFSSEKLRQLLGYGLPLIPSGLSLFIMNFADRFFLQRFTTLTEVGIYSLGYKFGMIVGPLVIGPYVTILRPKMFELAKRDDIKEIDSLLFTYFMLLIVFVALGISLVIKDTLQLISGPEYRRAYMIVPLILLSYILAGAYTHMQAGLLITKRTKRIAYVTWGGAASSLLLNLVLTPRFGIWGAAWATLLSFAIMFTLNLMAVRRIYPVRFEYTRVAKIIGLAALFYLISLRIHINVTSLSLCVRAGLALGYPLALLLLGFYTPREKREIREMVSKAMRWLKAAVKGQSRTE